MFYWEVCFLKCQVVVTGKIKYTVNTHKRTPDFLWRAEVVLRYRMRVRKQPEEVLKEVLQIILDMVYSIYLKFVLFSELSILTGLIIIIIYSRYPLHRSVFQWGPAKFMHNTVTIQYNAIRYDTTRYDTISFFQCSFLQLVSLEKSWILVENRCF